MKKQQLAMVISAALLAPLAAMAQGWYAGGTLGDSELEAWDNDSDTSVKLYGGYRFNNRFAAEAGYHDFGSFREGSARAEADALSLSAIGMLPLHSQWSLFARLGVARTDTEARNAVRRDDDEDFSLLAAFGVSWLVTPAVEVRADYELLNDVSFGVNSDSDIETLGVGAVYHF